jgi:hypothetical protein
VHNSARKINHKNHKGRANDTKSICVLFLPFVIFVVNSALNCAQSSDNPRGVRPAHFRPAGRCVIRICRANLPAA